MKILTRILLITAVIAGLWFAMHTIVAKKERNLAAFSARPRPLATVVIAAAKDEIWQRFLPAIGSFTAVQEVMVTNEIEGRVTAIHFTSGQQVERNDVLVNLDTSVDAAELQALLAEDRLHQLQFKRSERLVAENTISKSEFDIAAARRDEASANARAKSASVRKKTIVAPFSGVLGIRAVDLGEYLDAGAQIVSLQKLNPIYLDFGTPERFIDLVSIGQHVEAEVHAYAGEIFHGKISAVEPGIERATRNMRIRAEFENADQRLRSGMFAEITSAVPRRDQVITIPETAVAYTPYGNSVFVVADSGDGLRAKRRQIETGEVRAGRISVTGGLIAGEQIVSAGHNKLRNGMAVQLGDGAKLPALERDQ